MNAQPEPARITLPGSHGPALGCLAWDPACAGSELTPRGDGTQVGTFPVPPGDYDYKVALAGSWDINYGADGVPRGANLRYSWGGGPVTFRYHDATHRIDCTAGGGIEAQWVDRATIAVPADSPQAPTADRLGWNWELATTDETGTVTGTELVLEPLKQSTVDRMPAAAGYLGLHLDDGFDARTALTQGLELVGRDPDGWVRYRSGVQIAGVLDDLYADAAGRTLGVVWRESTPTLTVWAPTALEVSLLLWPGSILEAAPERLPMARTVDGCWTISGNPGWANRPYRFQVKVYAPLAGGYVINEVTDPYSIGLTVNSTHSLLVDLADPALTPQRWLDEESPVIARAVDRAVYELHVRDFSVEDGTVPEELRGRYLAFTVPDSAGITHLTELAAAGINTIHLLPTFDFSTVPEHPDDQHPPLDLSHLPADSAEQQRLVGELASSDGYNWGYDPFHWQTPEGSYAVGDGLDRIVEFREMVAALHGIGLSVVLDQVYNHTAAAGQHPHSVLDKVVPGYYHRLCRQGRIEESTCCFNVATEHLMAGKLMVDSVLLWARHYKVDGFRFDLMGHHSRANMLAVRAALDELTLAADGIDGRAIHLYGEGWNFGEVADDRLFIQARQGNLGGTGIGCFNDRLRDAIHGGGSSDAELRTQGFGSGLYTDPNPDSLPGDPASQLAWLRHLTDLVQLGLVGNLRAFTLRTGDGRLLRGDQIEYGGQPAAYCDQPDEAINYVDAHDNQTLFDLLLLRLPDSTSMSDLARMSTLSLATAVLSQSPCFLQAGTDLLRSKSFDANSYNSGDWFNAIDWSGKTNGFGRGLPPAAANRTRWAIQAPMLADPANRPSAADIAAAGARARDLFRLRGSSPLFRLGTAAAIIEKVTFPVSGPWSEPGTITMLIDDTVGPDVDPLLNGLLVVFNAAPYPVTQSIPQVAGRHFRLHPVQRSGADTIVRRAHYDRATGTAQVPGRTVAVLAERA